MVFIMKSGTKIILCFLILSLWIGGYTLQVKADTIRVAIGIEPDTLDPCQQATTAIAMMVSHVNETLVHITPEGVLEPLLARDWSISECNKEYIFYLREDILFTDGSPLNAEAVKFSLDRIIDPTISTPNIGFYGPLERVEVMDEYTVKVIFKRPFAPALMGFAWATAAIISPKSYKEAGIERFSRHPVGTGPFKMEAWKPGERVVMVRNEEYWRENAGLGRIEWIIVPEAGTRSAMVLAGDVHIAYQPPTPDIPRLEATSGLKVISEPSTRIMFVALNTTEEPFNNHQVRQAVNYAVNTEMIVERILMGAGTPSDSPLPHMFFGYESVGTYHYDPDKARDLLREAGYGDGFEVTFIHPTGRYILDAEIGEIIQSFLAEVGIVANLSTMDWPTYVGTMLQPADEIQHQMNMLGWGNLSDAHHTLYSMFHSSQSPPTSVNTSFYNNPKVDDLIDRGSQLLDIEERRLLYREAQEIIWEDAPWLFLYTQNMVLGVLEELKGLTIYPWEIFSLYGAYIQ